MTGHPVGALQSRLADVLAGLDDEPGGAACVVRDGEVLAHARTGTDGRGSPWAPDTLVMSYSVAKPLAALAVLSVVAEGRVGLDDPAPGVRDRRTTVRHVLTHQAGLPSFPPAAADVAYDDRPGLLALLAAAEPQWEPGTAIGEHALTYGHLCGAIVEAATGRSLAETWAALAAEHGWDLHLAVPETELGRVADVVPHAPDWPGRYLTDPRWAPTLERPVGLLDPDVLNSRRFRTTPFEAVSLHASAEGIARFWADLVPADGPVARRLGPDLHAACLGAQATGEDRVIGRPVAWTLVAQVDPGEVGMGGAGGCAGWANLDKGYAAGWVTRGLGSHERTDAVFEAIEAILD